MRSWELKGYVKLHFSISKKYSVSSSPGFNIQLCQERSEKSVRVHATTPKGTVGSF